MTQSPFTGRTVAPEGGSPSARPRVLVIAGDRFTAEAVRRQIEQSAEFVVTTALALDQSRTEAPPESLLPAMRAEAIRAQPGRSFRHRLDVIPPDFKPYRERCRRR